MGIFLVAAALLPLPVHSMWKGRRSRAFSRRDLKKGHRRAPSRELEGLGQSNAPYHKLSDGGDDLRQPVATRSQSDPTKSNKPARKLRQRPRSAPSAVPPNKPSKRGKKPRPKPAPVPSKAAPPRASPGSQRRGSDPRKQKRKTLPSLTVERFPDSAVGSHNSTLGVKLLYLLETENHDGITIAPTGITIPKDRLRELHRREQDPVPASCCIGFRRKRLPAGKFPVEVVVPTKTGSKTMRFQTDKDYQTFLDNARRF